MSSRRDKTRAEVERLIPVVAREGRRIVEAFAARHKLHQTDIEALSCLIRAETQHPPLTAGDLRNELGLTSGATTFLMARLERAGLIQRTRDTNDQRRVHVHLSAVGRELSAAIHPPVLAASDFVMNAFTTAELDTIRRFLAATAAAMSGYRASLLKKAHEPKPRDI